MDDTPRPTNLKVANSFNCGEHQLRWLVGGITVYRKRGVEDVCDRAKGMLILTSSARLFHTSIRSRLGVMLDKRGVVLTCLAPW